LTTLLEKNLLPDALIRFGIRRLVASRQRELEAGGEAAQQARYAALLEELRRSPIALSTGKANEQHYELPPEFFEKVLGRHLKYSCCYWPEWVENLDQAEEAMLELTAGRAGLADGQEILELGCGWGSLTFYMARRYPKARILAVSNSRDQQAYLKAETERYGLSNVELQLADVNTFDPGRRFDRVVSVEMFEHMRNYGELFERIAGWTRPGGQLFVHVFCHRKYPYPFEVQGPGDWMARYFFTGGMMPSADLFEHFCEPFELEKRWLLSGEHYDKTAMAWLANMDRRRDELRPLFDKVYGRESTKWWVYWRVFFLACAELFAFRGGEEWGVAHYRFQR